MYIQRESSGKTYTKIITVITSIEEIKIGSEGKTLFLTLNTSLLFEYFITQMCILLV